MKLIQYGLCIFILLFTLSGCSSNTTEKDITIMSDELIYALSDDIESISIISNSNLNKSDVHLNKRQNFIYKDEFIDYFLDVELRKMNIDERLNLFKKPDNKEIDYHITVSFTELDYHSPGIKVRRLSLVHIFPTTGKIVFEDPRVDSSTPYIEHLSEAYYISTDEVNDKIKSIISLIENLK